MRALTWLFSEFFCCTFYYSRWIDTNIFYQILKNILTSVWLIVVIFLIDYLGIEISLILIWCNSIATAQMTDKIIKKTMKMLYIWFFFCYHRRLLLWIIYAMSKKLFKIQMHEFWKIKNIEIKTWKNSK